MAVYGVFKSEEAHSITLIRRLRKKNGQRMSVL